MRALMRGLMDAEFQRQYGTEAQCATALLAVRQAAGMACPAGGNTRISVSGRRIGCSLCNRRWSLTSGTARRCHNVPAAGGHPARAAPRSSWLTAIANLSTAIKATHKAISAKHAGDYPGASCWTTNRRRDRAGMVPALCRAIPTSSRLTRRSVYAA